ncbi:nicotinate phosphoribosyltransferase [Salicibibacter cibarius]|uniref:Nicotinate phosphoribosyltransferase n=1 Tax=Salicibibacter cibarius TaxID=2743000 RepID=A0A7T6Z7K4_9BACI|nr:nicotinate phosphoribosyltransferase [Salicibibacter cibarius]
MINYLQAFHFSESDLDYLEELGYRTDYIDFLRTVYFTGSVRAMKEGEVAFGDAPILRIEAPLIEAQLIETALLNIVNYQTLIATKASRIKQVVGGEQPVSELGTRRAHEFDAALWGTRATYIGGFSSTSNVRAGKRFDLPTSGTHAHSYVQAYQNEYIAFHRYAKSHSNCVSLVDTYDTIKSGVPTAIKVAKELGNNINFEGIRIDSGDLAYLSKEARKLLDQAGFFDTKIYASNDLDEYTIMNLRAQGAKIDAWGVGTKAITAFDQPALGSVYKLVSIEDENGQLRDTIKLSASPEKVTTPGLKKVFRIINNHTKKAEGDYIALANEQPEKEGKLHMFHPVHTHIGKFVTHFTAKDLHENIIDRGTLAYECPHVQEIQSYAEEQLNLLWEEYKRSLNPAEYPVNLSQACWDNKMKNIEKAKKHSQKPVPL